MSSILKTATSLACLAAVALAGPINGGSLSQREWTDCPTGTVFYSCANGYRGCFEKDPCALPPATTTSSLPTTITGAPAPPTPTTCQSGSLFRPTMYNIYPSQPDLSEPAVTRLEVHANSNSAAGLEQVAAFSGIPAGAKTCNLMWAQASESERTFVVDGNGLVGIQPLTGIPAVVSANSVAPFVSGGGKPTTADFTFWDKQSKDARNHTVGAIACAESVYYKLSINTANGDGHVYLEQDGKNGFYINYTC